MVEKDFQFQLMNGLQRQGLWVQKWPDSAFGVVKPFDLCAAYSGQFTPIEVKLRKLRRQKPIGPQDRVVCVADFEGNQLPELMGICDRGQGHPKIAAFIMRETLGRVQEKRGWIISVLHFRQRDEWTVQDFMESNCAEELVWVSQDSKRKAGWTCPWYPKVETLNQSSG